MTSLASNDVAVFFAFRYVAPERRFGSTAAAHAVGTLAWHQRASQLGELAIAQLPCPQIVSLICRLTLMQPHYGCCMRV